jgi:hypothetical protein
MKLFYVNALDCAYSFGPFIDFKSAHKWADYVDLPSYAISDKAGEHINAPYIRMNEFKGTGKVYG